MGRFNDEFSRISAIEDESERLIEIAKADMDFESAMEPKEDFSDRVKELEGELDKLKADNDGLRESFIKMYFSGQKREPVAGDTIEVDKEPPNIDAVLGL